MARRLRIEFPGAIYHVMNRGIARRTLFRGEKDTVRFEKNLAETIEIFQVRLHAYCLLPNHFHLLVETPRANLGAFMQALQTRYGVYFNRKYRKAGHVYQGPYKAILVEEGEYLLKLSRYIHLNAVETQAYKDQPVRDVIKALRKYQWSSYRGYIGLEKKKDWMRYDCLEEEVKTWFGARKGGVRKYVEAGLAETDVELAEVLKSGGLAIGAEKFVDEVKSRYRRMTSAGIRKKEDVVSNRDFKRRSVGHILKSVCHGLGVEKEDLMRRRGGGLYRGVAIQMLLKYGGLNQRQAAGHIGVSTGAAVSVRLKDLKQAMKKDKRLTNKVKQIEVALNADD